ncbi:unnamed protein product [Didymodactylos carnosus]|uniref:Uncharacterized protein n=1 Tax=Didymodactylos carnosus TaxID=1234261 RepID=A0A8S2W1M8_9BILA|nr:unnamed protein product [Didymodactylos carnosus]
MASEAYAGASWSSSLSEQAVLFEIEANTGTEGAKPLADITKRSASEEEEQEILFMLGGVFKILDISRNKEKMLWIIKLVLSGEKESEQKPVFVSIGKEISDTIDLSSIGSLYMAWEKLTNQEDIISTS